MNTKKIVQIIVIVAAFFGTGLVIYNGFFKNQNNDALLSTQPATEGSSPNQAILPYGNSLDFDVLKKQNFIYTPNKVQPLDFQFDVGIPEDSLISPAAP